MESKTITAMAILSVMALVLAVKVILAVKSISKEARKRGEET